MVLRSLITLKALTDDKTGAIVAAFPHAFTHLTLVQAVKTLANPTADVAARYVDPRSAHPVAVRQ